MKRLLFVATAVFLASSLPVGLKSSELTLSENDESLIVENQWCKAEISPKNGGVLKSLFLKSTKTDLTFFNSLGLDARGIGEDFGGNEGWPGEPSTGKYDYQIIEKTREKIVVRLWYKAVSQQVAGLQFGKTFIFRNDTPAIQMNLCVKNEGKNRSFNYRSRNSVRVAAGKDSQDVYFAPTPKGVEMLHLQTTSFGDLMIKEPARGWIGKLDKITGAGILFCVDHALLEKFYYYLGKLKGGTIEWWYRDVLLKSGEDWETAVFIVPTDKLASYSFASEKIAASLDCVREKNGLVVNLESYPLSARSKVEISAEALDCDQRVVAGLGAQVRDFSAAQTVRTSFQWKDVKDGAYGIRVNFKENGRLTDSFIQPVSCGKTGKTYVLETARKTSIPPLSDKTSARDPSSPRNGRKEGMDVLVVQWYTGDGHFNVVKSLKTMPDPVRIAIAKWVGMTEQGKLLPLEDFPASEEELARYDLVILEDIPYLSIGDQNMRMIDSYVKSGGAMIVLGGAFAFQGSPPKGRPGTYKDTLLEKILPVEVSADKDRSPEKCVRMGACPDHPVIRGLPWDENVRCAFNKVKARKEAAVLLEADGHPLLTVWEHGRGRVAAFPLTFDDEKSLGMENARDNLFVFWNYYDDFWRQLAGWCARKTCDVGFDQVKSMARESWSGENGNIEGRVKNGGNAPWKGRIHCFLQENKKIVDEKKMECEIKAGAEEKFSFPMELKKGRSRHEFHVALEDSRGKTLAKRDGTILGKPRANIEISPGPRIVFGRNAKLRLTWRTSEGVAKGSRVCAGLVDSCGKEILRTPEIPVEKDGVQEIGGELGIGNLASGEYRLEGRLLQDDRTVDEVCQPLHIAPWLDREDFFPNIMWGFSGYSTSGWEIRPKDEEMLEREISWLKELGVNGILSYYYFDLNTFDAAQRSGLVYMSQVSYDQWFNYPVKNAACVSAVYPRTLYQKVCDDLGKYHGNSPRLFALHGWDEPGVGHNGFTPADKEAFKAKYGYEMPVKMEDRNYIQTQRFRTSSQVQQAKKMKAFLEEWQPGKYKMEGVISPHSMGVSTSLLDMAGFASFHDYVATDPYVQGYDVDYYASWAWAVTGHGKGAQPGVVHTGGCALGGPYYPKTTGEKVYCGLTHGAKALFWFTWLNDFCAFNDPVKKPDHFRFAKKAFEEARWIGPLFQSLAKRRAKAAMLIPWTHFALQCPPDKTVSFMGSLGLEYKTTWILLEKLLGCADMIFEEQIVEDTLGNYNLLFIPTARYIPDNVMARIKSWVEKGGLLIVVEGAATHNEFQEEVKTLSSILTAGGGISACGKGKTLLLTEQNADLLAGFAGQVETLVAKSSTDGVTVRLFDAGNRNAHYLCMANHNRYAVKSTIQTGLSRKTCFVYDLVTREELKIAGNSKGMLEIPVELDELWGKAIAILPSKPAKLKISISGKECVLGGKLDYQLELFDQAGRRLAVNLPVDIEIIGPDGRKNNDYSAMHVIKEGVFKKQLVFADNDLPGKWIFRAKAGLLEGAFEAAFNVNPK
ncbi:MAG: glutamine amidotransferase [Verrucomicrobiae bacterium]|nr:glutamine amidotransferase [Verrucomicrobiae bacterium]